MEQYKNRGYGMNLVIKKIREKYAKQETYKLLYMLNPNFIKKCTFNHVKLSIL